jgi:hypothetical protein
MNKWRKSSLPPAVILDGDSQIPTVTNEVLSNGHE